MCRITRGSLMQRRRARRQNIFRIGNCYNERSSWCWRRLQVSFRTQLYAHCRFIDLIFVNYWFFYCRFFGTMLWTILKCFNCWVKAGECFYIISVTICFSSTSKNKYIELMMLNILNVTCIYTFWSIKTTTSMYLSILMILPDEVWTEDYLMIAGKEGDLA